ncbi:MAG: hypothetical protein JNM94_08185 [Phycisphaerae bacterium]|nr:hypothetical protein [Phycisphaerae bacterium]
MFQTTTSIILGTLVVAAATALGGGPPAVVDLGPVPGDDLVGLAARSQQDHSIARGLDSYLVAWTETRAGGVGNGTNMSDIDVFALRLAFDGTPIGQPFAVTLEGGVQQRPRVAWNGSQWLVAYESQDPTPNYFQTNVRGVRVDAMGNVVDASPILLAADEQYFAVSGQGGEWLFTWPEYAPNGVGQNVMGRRLANDGTFADAAPTTLLSNAWWLGTTNRTLAANGEYLVVTADWADSAITKARRIGLNGQPIGAAFTVPSPNMATNGDEYYVTWLSNFTNLVGSRMTKTGTLLTPRGTLITNDYSQYWTSVVAHDGATWWVEWNAANLLRLARVDASGAVLDPGGVAVPNGASGTNDLCYAVQLAAIPAENGGGVHVLWWDVRASQNGDANVYKVSVSANGVVGDEVGVSIGTSTQRLPDFAGGPNGARAVVFLSEGAFEKRVLVSRLGSDGVVLDAEPIEVAAGATLAPPSIAWNGSVYLVVWSDNTGVKARRMNADGSFVDASPISVMSGFNVGVDAVGDVFLVAATRYGATPQTIYAQARRYDGSTGSFLDAGTIFLGGGYVSVAPRVHSDGARWMVAYHSMWSALSSQGDAIVQFVNADGTATGGSNPTPFSGATGDPDIAFSGSNYLIVWRMNTLGQPDNYIMGRTMALDGALGPTFTVAQAAGRQLRPVATWDGETFVVAWDDQRHRTSFFDARTWVYATRVTAAGSVLDPAGLAIDAGEHPAATAAIERLGTGETIVADARFLPTADLSSYRVALMTIGVVPEPADLDGNGSVNGADLAILLGAWGEGGAADLDGSGSVDGADLGLLLGAWTG